MKKKIFILGHWMRIDGVATSLFYLLKELDYSKVDVDLMLMSAEGELLPCLPKEIHLLKTHPAVANYWSSNPTDAKKSPIAAIIRFVTLILAGIWYRLILRKKIDPYGMGLIKGFLFSMVMPKTIVGANYDLAIFFSCEPFLSGRVKAKKSAVWVHTDWGRFNPIRSLLNIGFGKADFIVNVSKEAKDSFDKYLNRSSLDKSIVIENVLSPKWVAKRALEYQVDEICGLKLLSVGRVSKPKNYFRALEAAKVLAERGVEFVWYVVGGGEELKALSKAVEASGIANKFRLEGMKTNPYPYLKWANIVVCTSDWEGKSVTVREAQMMCKPVVVTRFPTAASQVEDGVDGLLVDRTPEAVADGIMRYVEDAALRNRISRNCSVRDYANLGEIDKILRLGEGERGEV